MRYVVVKGPAPVWNSKNSAVQTLYQAFQYFAPKTPYATSILDHIATMDNERAKLHKDAMKAAQQAVMSASVKNAGPDRYEPAISKVVDALRAIQAPGIDGFIKELKEKKSWQPKAAGVDKAAFQRFASQFGIKFAKIEDARGGMRGVIKDERSQSLVPPEYVVADFFKELGATSVTVGSDGRDGKVIQVK